jgi:hypothetical protein
MTIIKNIGIFVTILLLLTVGRIDSVLSPTALNPDEAQLGANARRIISSGLGFLNSDGTTSGPLNSVPLLWPWIFGGSPNLQSGRLMALLMLATTIYFIHQVLRNWAGERFAWVGTLCSVLLFTLTSHPDFLHYSSELLSVVILTGTVLLIVRFFSKNHINRLAHIAAIGVIIGATPYTKLQSVPIAIALSFVFIWLLYRQSANKSEYFVFFASGSVLTLFFVSPLVFAGSIDLFTKGYLGLARNYVSTPLTLFKTLALADSDPLLRILISITILLAITLFIKFFLGQISNRADFVSKNGTKFVIATAYASAALLAVSFPGREFPHYLVLLWPGVIYLLVLLLLAITSLSINTKSLFVVTSLLIALVPFANPQALQGIAIRSTEFLRADWERLKPIEKANLWSWTNSGKNDHMLVWGWMPQWYLLASQNPATRETMNENQIRSSGLQEYFLSRLRGDLQQTRPELILDAVGGSSFAFNNSEVEGARVSKFLGSELHEAYEEIKGLFTQENCARTYLRKDLANKKIAGQLTLRGIKKVTTNMKSEIGTPSNLFDFSYTEDQCLDYWIPEPQSQKAVIEIELETPSRIDQINILQSFKSPKGFANEYSVELKAVSTQGVVWKSSKKLNPWPTWTTYQKGGSQSIESITITFENVDISAPAVNEIQIVAPD